MKKLFFLFLSLSLVLIACKKDDDPITDLELHYDGPNQSAPFFDPGTHHSAARFNVNVMRQYDGKQLEAVEFYLVDRPQACEIRIYGVGTSSEPGNLLYSADVSSGTSANTWNRHTLSSPLTLDGDDLWISVIVTTDARLTIMGCDTGPANSNGDWIFTEGDANWETFRERTNQQVNINWNIRGDLTD